MQVWFAALRDSTRTALAVIEEIEKSWDAGVDGAEGLGDRQQVRLVIRCSPSLLPAFTDHPTGACLHWRSHGWRGS